MAFEFAFERMQTEPGQGSGLSLVFQVVPRRGHPKYLDIPSMVRMDEIVSAFSISELGVHEEARADRMRATQRFGKADAQV